MIFKTRNRNTSNKKTIRKNKHQIERVIMFKVYKMIHIGTLTIRTRKQHIDKVSTEISKRNERELSSSFSLERNRHYHEVRHRLYDLTNNLKYNDSL